MTNPQNIKVIEPAAMPGFRDAVFAILGKLGVSFPDPSRIVILPGFCDVHVHFREPGFSYKETIVSGCASAARGGYTAVCTMPNLNPVPDCPEHLRQQLDLIEEGATIEVYPYGAITVGEKGAVLADMAGMARDVVGFSDDGKGIQTAEQMRSAMLEAKSLGKMIVAHCEDDSLLHGGYIHDGAYAAEHGHRGICSESEYGPILRDLKLVEETGCAYHVCHISAKESVAAIREAKKRGVNVTCETGPHYLALSDRDLQEEGRFKMNPPLRDESDRLALIEGVLDGTIDMIATDHAPHSAEEKSKGLEKSSFGIVGLETAFPVLYKTLVESGLLTLERLAELLAVTPRKRFSLPLGSDFTVWDMGVTEAVDPDKFASMGRATPFTGMEFPGKCLLTVHNETVVYQAEEL